MTFSGYSERDLNKPLRAGCNTSVFRSTVACRTIITRILPVLRYAYIIIAPNIVVKITPILPWYQCTKPKVSTANPIANFGSPNTIKNRTGSNNLKNSSSLNPAFNASSAAHPRSEPFFGNIASISPITKSFFLDLPFLEIKYSNKPAVTALVKTPAMNPALSPDDTLTAEVDFGSILVNSASGCVTRLSLPSNNKERKLPKPNKPNDHRTHSLYFACRALVDFNFLKSSYSARSCFVLKATSTNTTGRIIYARFSMLMKLYSQSPKNIRTIRKTSGRTITLNTSILTYVQSYWQGYVEDSISRLSRSKLLRELLMNEPRSTLTAFAERGSVARDPNK